MSETAPISMVPKTEVSIKPRLLTVAGACAYTSFSRAYLYRENKAGNLKFIKIDGSTRIEVPEADRWIDEKSRKAVA